MSYLLVIIAHIVAPKIWNLLRFIPLPLRKMVAHSLLMLPDSIWDNRIMSNFANWKLSEKIAKIRNILAVNNPREMYTELTSYWREPKLVIGTNGVSIPQQFSLATMSESMMFYDSLRYLPDDILTKVDRASMFYGLEARVPFLDHRIVELSWRIPLHMKIKNGSGKSILRNILHKHVPLETFGKVKMGFALPIHKWLRGPLAEWAEDLLDEKRLVQDNFFDAAIIRNKWEEHKSGRKSWQHHLWAVLMFQMWQDEHLSR